MDGITLFDLLFILASELIFFVSVMLTLIWIFRAREVKIHFLLAFIVIALQLLWNSVSNHYMMASIFVPGVSTVMLLLWRRFLRDDYTKGRLFGAMLWLQGIWLVLYVIILIERWVSG